ncbi:MAG: bifunctional proline dehydrogenase/L-glutamate gamma-semialdehyde dehydrogenase PutA [Pseudomonadota bacterium]
MSNFALFAPPIRPPGPLRSRITDSCRSPEPACVPPLAAAARVTPTERDRIAATAAELVTRLRAKHRTGTVHALIHEYALSSPEGVALMCLAEALLRIPDDDTRDALIRDKIAPGHWQAHLGKGRSLFVNAATWGLVVTGKLTGSADEAGLGSALTRMIARLGEPVIRSAVNAAMRLMGEQFVLGQTIEQALERAREREGRGFSFSYDMLGEAAMTAADAENYYLAYEAAIDAIGTAAAATGPIAGPGISIKLSALHPRYVRAQAERVMTELLPRARALALLARRYDIGLNIDAEEADRLELSLDILQSLAEDPALAEWDGLGFVVQAYQKRCPAVIDWIVALARRTGRRLMVRLVKGAYWDAEIKRAQVDGLADYPVFTRKVHTDVAYIACARKLLAAPDAVFPQFATHNAQTVATILHVAGGRFSPGDYEFQCLHGMGEPLYDEIVTDPHFARPCRIYAPVGTHDTLLAYLVRRLLENGANSSFVHRLSDPSVPVADLVADPAETVLAMAVPGSPHPRIGLPAAILPGRRNSRGLDFGDEQTLAELTRRLCASARREWSAGLTGADRLREAIRNPADHSDIVGYVVRPSADDATCAARAAQAVAVQWAAVPVEQRAATLERAADLMQQCMPELMGLIIREAGRTASNAAAEVREAIDFLRYYSQVARRTLTLASASGPIVCISPWNFPLAIFTGQVSAAVAAGNPVLAKPSAETPLVAAAAVAILHEAGVPTGVLQLLPGDGTVGAALVAAPETAGVVFTGSTEVARSIQRQLAGRLNSEGEPVPFIAETGGLNAMIVDSSALTEQVVADALTSAFDSAGQRCSALRLLCLHEGIADRTVAMLKGAMDELTVGNPNRIAVDIGPVISAHAQAGIAAHITDMRRRGFPVHQADLPEGTRYGTFVAPALIELPDVAELTREVFGPVLHVVRYDGSGLGALIARINATGYGLTFGLHTRLDATVEQTMRTVAAGNHYVNRSMIGAVVGVQPFGGRGLSGTGPKAGGPLYLARLARGAAADLPAPARASPPGPLTLLLRWLESEGRADLARAAREQAQGSRLGQTIELPGPVGERNSYALRARGRIAVLAGDVPAFWLQVAAVLATGNIAVAVYGTAISERPPGFPAELLDHVEWPDADLVSAPDLAAALISGDTAALAAASLGLAARQGPVVPLIPTCPDQSPECPARSYDLDRLVDELAISINMAATGGNASLMAST